MDYGCFFRELEGLEELGSKGSIENGSALGEQEIPFLSKDRMGTSY